MEAGNSNEGWRAVRGIGEEAWREAEKKKKKSKTLTEMLRLSPKRGLVWRPETLGPVLKEFRTWPSAKCLNGTKKYLQLRLSIYIITKEGLFLVSMSV